MDVVRRKSMSLDDVLKWEERQELRHVFARTKNARTSSFIVVIAAMGQLDRHAQAVKL